MIAYGETWDNGDGVLFDIKKNVKSIQTDVKNSCKTIHYHDGELNVDPHIFFAFETPSHSAFAHWVFESAVFLPYFANFKNARILVNKNPTRDYKQLFFNLFGINESNIFHVNRCEDSSIIDYENIPENNICIICRNFLLTDLSEKSRDTSCLNLYRQIVTNFKNIMTPMNVIEKTIEHLFLPRNSSQNYTPNDRVIDYTQIRTILAEKEYTLYKTSDTTDFHAQIQLVRSAKHIYLDWGSNYFVNGFFANASNIYIVNQMMGQLNYPFLMIIFQMIQQANTLIYL